MTGKKIFRLNFKLSIGILKVITLFLPHLGFKREDMVFSLCCYIVLYLLKHLEMGGETFEQFSVCVNDHISVSTV